LQGSVSDPVELGDNRLVMIKLKEHLPVALRPLDDVRDEIVKTLTDNLARENAKSRAMTLLAELKEGQRGLEELATEAGFEYGRHELIKRNTSIPDVELVKGVFRLAEPTGDAPVQVVLPTLNGFAVVEMDSVVDGVLEGDALFAKSQYERVIANISASQEASAIMRQLRISADVEVFEDRIK
jgi:peptidyl-prolyl cis-trans isomerase D